MTRLFGIFAVAVLLISGMQLAHAKYPCGPGRTLQDGVCKPYLGPNTGYYGYGYDYRYRHHHHCWWRHGQRYCRWD